MALTNKPYGLEPLFMTEARKTALYLPITNNYGTALYIQDPVVAVTAGTIERGATNAAWCGVILGLYRQETPTSLRTERLLPVQYMAASPGATYNYFALVAVDPDLFFMMQEDGDTSSLIITDNFGNCDIVSGTGNTTTGISGAMIDSSSADNTATRPIKLIFPAVNVYDLGAGAYKTASAAGAAGNYCDWIVKINNHQFGPGAVSVGLA